MTTTTRLSAFAHELTDLDLEALRDYARDPQTPAEWRGALDALIDAARETREIEQLVAQGDQVAEAVRALDVAMAKKFAFVREAMKVRGLTEQTELELLDLEKEFSSMSALVHAELLILDKLEKR